MRSDIPSRTEDQKVCERRSWVARRSRQDAKNGRINVIDRNRTNIDELRQVVLVRDIVAVPRDDIEWGVFLLTDEKFAAQLVNDLPRFLLNLVLCDWVQEVSGVGKSIRS
jgi:hypothetical protein